MIYPIYITIIMIPKHAQLKLFEILEHSMMDYIGKLCRVFNIVIIFRMTLLNITWGYYIIFPLDKEQKVNKEKPCSKLSLTFFLN